MGELFPELASRRLRGRVHHVAFGVVLPTVVNATQPALFVAPVKKRRSPMRAVLFQKTDPAIGVAKRDQLFSQKPHLHGRAVGRGDLLG
jgi:hypothetical protein